MESPDSFTQAPPTPTDNADKTSKEHSARDVYKTTSLQEIDSSSFPELSEPAWSKFLPPVYNERRVISLSAFQMKWAVQVVAGIAVLFFGFGE